MTRPDDTGLAGVRLLSHRPSVLFKLARLGTDASADPAESGVIVSGPGWEERLREAIAGLSHAERASLFAVRLDDGHGLPLPAATLLDRARTDWFPKFLSQGQLVPVFQPIVDLRDGSVHGREALVRGRLGRAELRGSELVEAAEVHDALFSFDARARAAAIAAGLPILPPGEILYVNLDPRGVLDMPASLRSVWPVAEMHGGGDGRIGLELVAAERYPDMQLLESLVAAHREHGARISLDNVSGGVDSLRVLEALGPDLAKLSRHVVKELGASASRRRLIGALVDVAHDLGTRVVAVGIERDTDLDTVLELDVDYGQGVFLGQPIEDMLPVETRLVAGRAKALNRGPV